MKNFHTFIGTILLTLIISSCYVPDIEETSITEEIIWTDTLSNLKEIIYGGIREEYYYYYALDQDSLYRFTKINAEDGNELASITIDRIISARNNMFFIDDWIHFNNLLISPDNLEVVYELENYQIFRFLGIINNGLAYYSADNPFRIVEYNLESKDTLSKVVPSENVNLSVLFDVFLEKQNDIVSIYLSYFSTDSLRLISKINIDGEVEWTKETTFVLKEILFHKDYLVLAHSHQLEFIDRNTGETLSLQDFGDNFITNVSVHNDLVFLEVEGCMYETYDDFVEIASSSQLCLFFSTNNKLVGNYYIDGRLSNGSRFFNITNGVNFMTTKFTQIGSVGYYEPANLYIGDQNIEDSIVSLNGVIFTE